MMKALSLLPDVGRKSARSMISERTLSSYGFLALMLLSDIKKLLRLKNTSLLLLRILSLQLVVSILSSSCVWAERSADLVSTLSMTLNSSSLSFVRC